MARRCRLAGLSAPAARWVDARTAEDLGRQPWGRFTETLEARIKAADPALAEQRRREKQATRRVSLSPTNAEGMKSLTVLLPAAQIIMMKARIHQIARSLKAQGAHDTLARLEADAAFELCTNPLHALHHLLTTSTSTSTSTTGTGAGSTGNTGSTDNCGDGGSTATRAAPRRAPPSTPARRAPARRTHGHHRARASRGRVATAPGGGPGTIPRMSSTTGRSGTGKVVPPPRARAPASAPKAPSVSAVSAVSGWSRWPVGYSARCRAGQCRSTQRQLEPDTRRPGCPCLPGRHRGTRPRTRGGTRGGA